MNIFEALVMVATIENLHDFNKVVPNAKILVMMLEEFDQGKYLDSSATHATRDVRNFQEIK